LGEKKKKKKRERKEEREKVPLFAAREMIPITVSRYTN